MSEKTKIYVDFKVSVWERVVITEDIEETIEKIKSGKIRTANELIEEFGDADDHGCHYLGYLEETEETLSPEDNQGQSTLEIIDCTTTETIYTNE